MKKRLFSALLILSLLLCCLSPMASADGTRTHSEAKYLSDTLTLAGSGFEGIRTLTVSVIEALARDEALGYEDEYSLMTSGGEFSKHTFSGVKLYQLLIQEGMDPSLPDDTPVKFISKDGYTIPMTLKELRDTQYGRYSAKGGQLEQSGMPVLVAYACDGYALVGPTGTEPVTTRFTAETGYVEGADNIGGPLRLIIGQTSANEFNALNCAKWLSAIVVGDDNGYTYSRTAVEQDDMSEPDQSGSWTHGSDQSDFRLTITGPEARATVNLSLKELESLAGGSVREYYAASAGKNAYEGVTLKHLVQAYLKEGLEAPSKITVRSADGFTRIMDVKTVMEGIDSFYQPGKHKDVLLAWAVNGSPLVPGTDSPGYDGTNAYGPLRLVVENTISMWVKNVTEIVLGDTDVFSDVSEADSYYSAVMDVYEKGLMEGTGEGSFDPQGSLTRAQLVTILWRLESKPQSGSHTFADVEKGSWYEQAVTWAYSEGLVSGYDDTSFGPKDQLTREQMAAIFFRYAAYKGGSPQGSQSDLAAYTDHEDVSPYALTAMSWAVGQGYMDSLKDGLLHPRQSAARYQAAIFLSAFSNEG